MNCDRARQLCHDCIDDCVKPTEAAALEIHQARCETCRRFGEQMQELIGALNELRDMTSSVAGAGTDDTPGVAPKHLAAAPSSWTRRFGRVAAVIVFLVGAGLYLTVWTNRMPTTQYQSPQPIPDEPGREWVTSVVMTGTSAKSFLPVSVATDQKNVQLFLLFDLKTTDRDGS